MKVGIISALISRDGGGVVEVAREHARHLSLLGADVQVLGVGSPPHKDDLCLWGNLDVRCASIIGPKQIAYAPALWEIIKGANYDLLHLHGGVWRYVAYIAYKWGKINNKPYLITPHGMLDGWALKNSGLNKKLFSNFITKRAISNAACIHSLCKEETNAVRQFGVDRPICQIPNGVSVHEYAGGIKPKWYKEKYTEKKILLYFGRLHEKKNILTMLESLKIINSLEPSLLNGWLVVIAGWGESAYVAKLKDWVSEHKLSTMIVFVGSQYGDEKRSTYEMANAYILPAHSEGMPMTVLEAWSYGVPVLMTEECNLKDGIKMGAAFRIGRDKQEMARDIERFLSIHDADRRMMGRKGHELVVRDYKWDSVAKELLCVYKWVVEKGDMPKSIQLNKRS